MGRNTSGSFASVVAIPLDPQTRLYWKTALFRLVETHSANGDFYDKRPIRRIVFGFLGLLIVATATALVFIIVYHSRGVAEAERAWQNYEAPEILDFGHTRSLAVLPLVNWHTARDDLQGEMGVAYLVRTDSLTILFDVGHNAEGARPSPLLHNIAMLQAYTPGVVALGGMTAAMR